MLALSVLLSQASASMADAGASAGSDAQLGMQSGSRQHGILDAKLARRKLQQDVELLSNRVERLRQEERKAKQKVLETKLRGQEIMALQKRNDQAAQAKHLAKQMEEDQRKREMAQLRLERQAARDRIQKAQEAIAVARREDVKAEHQVKAENAQMVRSIRDYEQARAQKNRAEIRTHAKNVSLKFEKQRQAHQEFLAQDFINMIAMEDRRREEVEKEIAAMEIEERNHIERLRALQEEQKAAYDALEGALSTGGG